jgi:5-methylcytosine-specific restriction endonuclease McrA
VESDERSREGKDASPCPVCGGKVPPSLGGKPRKYCSKNCRVKAAKGIAFRDSLVHSCSQCGSEVKYAGRGPRWNIHCQACRSGAVSRKKQPFSEERICKLCSKPFTATSANRKKQYCSIACGKKSPLKAALAAERNRARTKAYKCLCCEQPFVRQKANGVYSCRKKYCSRECAFEARRLKLPAARRPLEIAKQLARWFHQWGDDVYPIVSRCSKCRTAIVNSRAGEDPHRPCGECSKPVRLCPGCGCCLLRRRLWCQECAAVRKTEAIRRERRKDKLSGKRAPSLRKRCRKFGVTYTPISRKKVFDRDKWRCQICGVKLLLEYTKIVGTPAPHPRSPTIDHIVPLSFGPSSPGHVLSNVQACCWQCNCLKSDQHPDSFVPPYATRLDY